MNIFPAIPFFRIMIPFVAGILCAIFTGVRWPLAPLFCVPVFLLAFADPGRIRNKMLLMVGLDVFFLLTGLALVAVTDTSTRERFYGKYTATDKRTRMVLMLQDQPVEKEKTCKLVLKVQQVRSGKKWVSAEGHIIAYVRKSTACRNLEAGQQIMAEGFLQAVGAPKNPAAFNYQRYLFNKQIYHTLFLDSLSWTVLNDASGLNPLIAAGIEKRTAILGKLKQSTLTYNSYAICAALLTGYDDDIAPEIMNAFSHSGTLHVLSVSGLHTGLIYLVLNFLLNYLDRKNRHKVLRFALVTVVLWYFALITGFSPPVLRAVIMFNMLGLGKLFFRGTYRNQLNILLVSAFILLNFNPWLITDIGFLLSYFAMFGLIYFQPLLVELWKPPGPVLKAFWTSVSASVAATLSTLPLTLFVFNQFPLWFFLCNLVVVPATFILLVMAFLVVVGITFFSAVINFLVDWLTWFIDLFNSPRWGYIDHVHFTFTDLLALSLFIVLLAAAWQYRSYRITVACLVVVIAWQSVSLGESWKAKNLSVLAVYENKKRSMVLLKDRCTSYLSTHTEKEFRYNVRGHFSGFNYSTLRFLGQNCISNGEHSVIMIDSTDHLPQSLPQKKVTLVMLNGRKLGAAELQSLPQVSRVVLDGTFSRYEKQRTRKLCAKFGVDFYDVSERGAFLLPL